MYETTRSEVTWVGMGESDYRKMTKIAQQRPVSMQTFCNIMYKQVSP